MFITYYYSAPYTHYTPSIHDIIPRKIYITWQLESAPLKPHNLISSDTLGQHYILIVLCHYHCYSTYTRETLRSAEQRSLIDVNRYWQDRHNGGTNLAVGKSTVFKLYAASYWANINPISWKCDVIRVIQVPPLAEMSYVVELTG